VAAAAPVAAAVTLLIVLDRQRVNRSERAAADVDLTPITLQADVTGVIDLPTGAGNAADSYVHALDLLEQERPRFTALAKQLDEVGVTVTTDTDLECLYPLLAGTRSLWCRFGDRLPHNEVETTTDRNRLGGLLDLGRLLAARSGVAAERGNVTEAVELARALIVFGWHVAGSPIRNRPTTGPAPTRPTATTKAPTTRAPEGPPAVSLDARKTGLTLIRWGAHALANLQEQIGDGRGADAATALEDEAGRTADALADRRRRMRDSLFLQIRMAREDPDRAFRVRAVTLIGSSLVGARQPILVGRGRYRAARDALGTLSRDPDTDVRAAATQYLNRLP